MATSKKISELSADSAIDGTEVLPVVDGGTTKKVTVQQIADFAGSGGGSTTYAALTDAATVNLPTVNTPLSTALGLKAPLASPTFTGTVAGITKAMVGLSNVDNTADSAKPVSTAQQTALDAKQATLVSGTNIKTINGATLLGSGDIAISGGGPMDFADLTDAATVDLPTVNTPTATALGLKAPLASPTFTGTPAAPTAAVDTNTTQVATTAFVRAQIAAEGGGRAVYDVTAYGADPNANTDDTQAIRDAIAACVADGGNGVIYFPAPRNSSGFHYYVDGPLITSLNSVNPNCQIPIPLYPDSPPSGEMWRIVFEGELQPSFATEGYGGVPRNNSGVIIESRIAGTGTKPSVFGSPWQTYGIGDRNYVYVDFQNLIIRTSTKSGGTDIAGTMSGLNMSKVLGSKLTNVKFDISSSIEDAVEPTNETYGVLLPSALNKVETHVSGCEWEGYNTGAVAQEHNVFENCIFFACINGITADYALHSITLNNCLWENCRNNIRMLGLANVIVNNYRTELHADSMWWDNDYDVYFDAVPGSVTSTGFVYEATQSVHINHVNQVTPAFGVEARFNTNDKSKVFIKAMNGVDFDRSFQSLTSGAGITWDLFLGHNATLTLNHNAALTLTNAYPGDKIRLFVTQGASAPFTLTPQGSFISPTGDITLSAVAGDINEIEGVYDGTQWAFKVHDHIAAASVVTFLHTFTGANSSTTAGPADAGTTAGAVAEQQLAGTWGITSNKGYLVSTATGVYVDAWDAGAADGTLTVDVIFGAAAIDAFLVFRATDVNNYLLFEFTATGGSLFKNIAGVFTSLGTFADTHVNGTYALKVTMNGTALECFVNGVSKMTYNTSTGQEAATLVGIGANNVSTSMNTGNEFDNLKLIP